jgi:hypothetical protein
MAETIQYFETDHIEHEHVDRDYEEELAALYAADALAKELAQAAASSESNKSETTE